MTEVYALQNVTVAEMKLRQSVVVKQEKVTNKSINKMKQEVKEAEKKTHTWEENRKRLDKDVSIACKKFAEEGIIEVMFLEAKVIRLNEMADDL